MYLKPRERKKREATRSYTTTRKKEGVGSWIAWKKAASAQGETCFKSLSPPTPPTLIYIPVEKKETKMFLFRFLYCCFFPFDLRGA